jgi:1-acyl-sn-glycerol-3-phosphate acyltransferase
MPAPIADEEVSAVISRLIGDPELVRQLRRLVLPPWMKGFLGSGWPASAYVRRRLAGIDDVAGFQRLVAQFVLRLVRETTRSFTQTGLGALSPDRAFVFVGNHRDIATDSLLLNYALYVDHRATVRIAVGSNLDVMPFVIDIIRLNKGFFVPRGEGVDRRRYSALLETADYIAGSIRGGESVWIAQREGRSKDGFDATDPSVLKMLTLPRRKEIPGDVLADLHLVPVSISYEFDPCDGRKAAELAAIERDGVYKKGVDEDISSLRLGLAGYKGRVCLRIGTELDTRGLSGDEVARAIDLQVLGGQQLFACNYVALSMLRVAPYSEVWNALQSNITVTSAEREQLLRRLPDDPLERLWCLRSYANPVVAKWKGNAGGLEPMSD